MDRTMLSPGKLLRILWRCLTSLALCKIYFFRLFKGKGDLFAVKPRYINAPIHLRNRTSDWAVYEEVFQFRKYDIGIDFQPGLIIDGGANAGYAAVWFANTFPASHIIAIEPEPSNFQMLEANTSAYPNIERVQAGIWNKNTFLKIEASEFEWSGNWDFRVQEVDHQVDGCIEAVTIDGILSNSNYETIDILKLDIEGSEKELFSRNYELWLGKVNVLIIELHDDCYKPGCQQAFYSAVEKYNFNETHRGGNVILTKQDVT